MVLLAIIVAVFCLAKPEAVIPFAKVKIGSLSITNVLLMVIMFGMGTTLKADDFKLILKRHFEVLAGIVGQFADHLVALPCAVATIIHQICGSITASIFAKKMDAENAKLGKQA